MKYFMDKKSWVIATAESLGILAFNAAVIPDFYSALGETVSTTSVLIVSASMFFLRIVWFYMNIVFRLFLEQRKK